MSAQAKNTKKIEEEKRRWEKNILSQSLKKFQINSNLNYFEMNILTLNTSFLI